MTTDLGKPHCQGDLDKSDFETDLPTASAKNSDLSTWDFLSFVMVGAS